MRRKVPRNINFKIVFAALLVAGIGFVVLGLPWSSAGRVLAATKQILPGDRLTNDNTELLAIDLEGRSEVYLTGLPSDSVASQAIGEGQFVPTSASANSVAVELASVAIELKRPLSSTIHEGQRVDVYATTVMTSGQASEPELVATRAWVRSIKEQTAMGQTSRVVEVAFAPEYLEPLLSAVSREDDITLVASGLRG